MWKRIALALIGPLIASFSLAQGGWNTGDPAFGRHSFLIGVNAANLEWVSSRERREILNNIVDSGVKIVRLTLRTPYDSSLDAMHIARDRGMEVLLTLSLSNKDFYPPGTRQSNHPYRLSDIDVERFRDTYEALWTKLEAAGIPIRGMEVGNEINWATFNDDLRPRDGERGQVFIDPAKIPDASQFNRGLDKYVELLRIVHNLRAESEVNRKMLILPAGLAQIRPWFAAHSSKNSLSIGATLKALHERGADEIVDAHSMHYYPDVKKDRTGRDEEGRSLLAECHAGDAAKPCWMTEWGVNNKSKSCPIDDTARAHIVKETRQFLDAAAAQRQLDAVMYFEWAGKSDRSIWRCGGLTESGRIAIAN